MVEHCMAKQISTCLDTEGFSLPNQFSPARRTAAGSPGGAVGRGGGRTSTEAAASSAEFGAQLS